jgi:hypothetical protein
MRPGKTLLCSGALLLTAAAPAAVRAQDVSGVATLERQLEQVRRDTRLQALKNAPVSQRALFDYGAYATVSYLSLDDAVKDNHILRQYEIVPYARLNFDGVHDFYTRARFVWQDWHSGDSFN